MVDILLVKIFDVAVKIYSVTYKQGHQIAIAPYRAHHDMVLCVIASIRSVHRWVLAKGTHGNCSKKILY